MSKEIHSLVKNLKQIGLTSYYEAHSSILSEIAPDGKYSSLEWNEATVEAIIQAVAIMIAKSVDGSLTTPTDIEGNF